MMTTKRVPAPALACNDKSDWPHEVNLLLSVLEDHCPFGLDRRTVPRASFRVQAIFELASQLPEVPWRRLRIYTRDANPGALGFIAPYDLPAGRQGTLRLPCPADRDWCIECTVLRCNRMIDGWYEGTLRFKTEQAAFRIEGDK